MKVIIYCSKFPPLAGGAGKSAHYLCQYLRTRGHQVYVLCEHAPGLKMIERVDDGYVIHRVKVPFMKNRGSGLYFLLLCLAIALKGIQISIKIKPDIFHFYDAATGIAGLITKFWYNKPSIYAFGGSMTYEYMCNSNLKNQLDPALGENHIWKNARGILKLILAIEKKFFFKNDRVYTAAQYLSDMLAQHWQLFYPKVRYIPNGIDTELLKRKNFEDIKTQLGYRFLIYVGVRLVKYKGLDVLIEACLPILDAIDAHLVIGGTGPEEQQLKQLANGHPRIHFLGNLSWEQNIQYVRSADLFVLPTLVDKTPNCIMEAIALEVPCITSDIAGVRELFPDHGGLLIKPNDPVLLREKIRWAFEHPEQVKIMARRARNFIVEQYDWKPICSKIEQLYFEFFDQQKNS
ncbi:MAG: glycosyltransferase family 4 protein [candidate division KSB1 bacterium]|nr:glycosyltransferase family 4 protein [candidate division KSB1 bacterium]